MAVTVSSGSGETPDIPALYVEALAIFGRAVQDVQDHEWDLPTPCEDWDVRQVVAHVVLGEAAMTAAIAGDDAMGGLEVDARVVGLNPMATWRGTALKAIDAARTEGLVDASYKHPSGRVRGAQLLGYRISENLVHAWDISVAVSRRQDPDNKLAEFVLDFWLPAVGDLQSSADYGDALMPVDGAAAGARLLALLGRS